MKLSPSIKSLISAAHAQPGAVPAPSRMVLTQLFDRIRSRAEQGGVGRESWLTLSTAGLLTVNSPEALCRLWDYAGDKSASLEERVRDAAVMRETGLKCISFNGIPRSIDNRGVPVRSCPGVDTHACSLPTTSNLQPTQERGRALWDSIYSPHHEKLLAKLGDSHPDLPVHILNSHYGPNLADPPQHSIVGRVLTSVIAISCLRAQTGVGPQVTSHVFGLKKALEGADGKGLQGQDWLVSDEGVEWVLESVDDISRTVTLGQGSFAKGMEKAKL
ncbi:hypothetical protein P7C73_g2150, partial [Tremellales sp. Uapishka_1]